LRKNTRVRLTRRLDDPSIYLHTLRSRSFANLTDRAVCPALEAALTEMFPNPSKYERV